MTPQITHFQLMAKPTGAVCNVDCSYCFYLEKQKLYPERKSQWKMNLATLEHYIKHTITSQKADVIEFIWQGGEPCLMGIEFYQEAIQLQQKYQGNKQIQNALQTNGTLLNDEWAKFFKQHHFLIGLSLDGDKTSHDQYRKTRTGKSYFDKVINALECLKRHQVDFNTLTVVNADNVNRPLETYQFLKSVGSEFMQFIPLVERKSATPDKNGLTLIAPDFSGQYAVTDWSVPASAYGAFLNAIFDEWLIHDYSTVFVMNFEQNLSKLAGFSGSCIINEVCGTNPIIEANGDIYACDHFVYPEYKLGNLYDKPLIDLVNQPKQIHFGLNKYHNQSRECQHCSVKKLCNGGCPKHRFLIASDGKPNKNYFCDSFKTHLHHTLSKMKTILALLQQNLPPALIQQKLRARFG